MSRQNKKTAAKKRLSVENLEGRRLLATTWQLLGSSPTATLQIDGDGLDNTISVFVSSGTVRFSAAGELGSPFNTGATLGDLALIRVNGNNGNDSITIQASIGTIPTELNGGDGNDTIRGNAGIDTITGGIGNDNLRGGDNSDTIDGGDGNDTILGENGNDTLLGGLNNDSLIGGAGDDNLTGGDGDDTLRGGLGTDALAGDSGDDTLQVSPMDTWNGGIGFDSVTAIDDYLAPADLTSLGLNVALTDADGIEKISGSPGNDVIDASLMTLPVQISGKAGDDNLIGGSGNDTILGEGDDDIITGNDGADGLTGGDGNDSISGGNGNDKIEGGSGDNVMNGDGGTDMLSYATVNTTSGVVVDLETQTVIINGWSSNDTISSFESVKGTIYADVIQGDDNVNVLDGNAGDDFLQPRGGADVLIGGTGLDTVSYVDSPAAVTINLADPAPEVGGDAQGDTHTSIEVFDGSDLDDVMTGNTANNIFNGLGGSDNLKGGGGNDELSGGDGNDSLTGGAGTDAMDGGADNDSIFADSDDDAAAFFTGGDGVDTLRAESDTVAVDWVLVTGSLFESVQGSNMADTIDARLVGDFGLTISSRNGNDTVYGTQLNDTINGGNDNDTIYGWTGADVIRGDAGNDTLFGNDIANADDNLRDRFFGGTGTDSATGINLSNLNAALRDTIDAAIESDLRV